MYGVISRGGADVWSVVLTDLGGWPANAGINWVWKLLFGSRKTRSVWALSLTASSQVITTVTAANDTITLIFPITPVQSATLPVGVYHVECEGTEAGGDEHYYNGAWGECTVCEPDGGG